MLNDEECIHLKYLIIGLISICFLPKFFAKTEIMLKNFVLFKNAMSFEFLYPLLTNTFPYNYFLKLNGNKKRRAR